MTRRVKARLRDAGFTPGVRHYDELFAILAGKDEDEAEAAEKALFRAGLPAAKAALSRLTDAKAPYRGRLARLIGKVAKDADELLAPLLALLDDPDPKTRRNAILALGKIRKPEVEEALLRVWEGESRVEMQRSLVASLGKVGGERSLAIVAAVKSDDPELTRLAGQATLMLGRTTNRSNSARIRLDFASPKPLSIALRTREGLEDVLIAELPKELSAKSVAKGVVLATLSSPLSSLFVARTWSSFAIRLPAVPIRDDDPVAALVSSLSSRGSRELFTSLTDGRVTYRLAWEEGGPRRADVWRAAAEVQKRAPELVNDPTTSAWQVTAMERGNALHVELEPRAYDDPRFLYRVKDVPAASHPTIAAALAKIGGVRDDDVVWDPFAGSGLELIERAKLGAYRALFATDLDDRAIEAMRANFGSAGVAPTIVKADAREHRVEGVTLILTNPPMGRRVGSRDDLGPLLDAFLENAASQLAPGGRLVWISPMAGTSRRAESLGFVVTRKHPVDMGGFHAELQAFEKRATRGRAR